FRAGLEWLRDLGLEDEFPEAFFLQMGIDRGGIDMRDLGRDVEVTAIYGAGREALCLIASRLTAKEFFVQAQQRGLLSGVVYSAEEALADEHVREIGYPIEVEHAELGRTFTYPGVPFKGANIPTTIRRAPMVGEHTDDVLGAR